MSLLNKRDFKLIVITLIIVIIDAAAVVFMGWSKADFIIGFCLLQSVGYCLDNQQSL